jgi:hypothetical protein
MNLLRARDHTLRIGKMAEAVKLYTGIGYPALQKAARTRR